MVLCFFGKISPVLTGLLALMLEKKGDQASCIHADLKNGGIFQLECKLRWIFNVQRF